MLLFGVVGYVFKQLDYPLSPLVLALVLGDMAESAFRQSMLLSGGHLSIFWSTWLVASIFGLGLVLLVWPFVSWAIYRKRVVLCKRVYVGVALGVRVFVQKSIS